MKKMLLGLFLAIATVMSFAQTYPYTNPTYIPTAIGPTTSFSTTGNYVFVNQGQSVLTTRITGTCTSLAGTVQGTNDGTNWTNLNLVAIPTGASAMSVSAPGFWRSEIGGMTQVRLHITALSAACAVTMASTPIGTVKADPCADPAVQKLSKVINQGASATTKVVDTSGTTSVYVCGVVMTASGTNPTVTITSGTHTSADCDTTAATLTGAMIPSATIGVISLGEYGGTIMSSAAGYQVCLTTAATTSVQGVMTYVQQ